MPPLHSLLSNAWTIFLIVVFFGGSIFVHELGHFLAARRRGLKVERFSIGFGPAIWSHRGKDGVEYRIAWLPFGGYVLLPQLVDLGPVEGKSQVDTAQLPPVSYASKVIVLVAGVAFNVLFAFALACIIWVAGQPETNLLQTTRIGYVEPTLALADGSSVTSPAAEAGLRANDVIQAVDHHPVSDWNEIRDRITTSGGRDSRGRPESVFTIVRGGRTLEIPVYPRLSGIDQFRQVGIGPAFRLAVHEVEKGSLGERAGIKPGDEILEAGGATVLSDSALDADLAVKPEAPLTLRVRRNSRDIAVVIPPRHPAAGGFVELGVAYSTGLHMTYPSPLRQIWEQVAMTFRTLVSLINPHSDIGLSKMAGPIGIVHIFNYAVASGLREVLAFTILVNVNLAIFNLLPIPVLDGGHLLFATIGRLRRRDLPQKFIMATTSVFMVLLFSMIIYVSYFNVRRWAYDAKADRAGESPKP